MSTQDTHVHPDIPPKPILPKPPPIPTYTGTVTPKYLLLNLVFAPPGASSGGADSKVSYTTQSSTGQTTSLAASFKAGVTVNASIGAAGVGVGVEYTASASASQTDSVEITKSESYQLTVSGPPADGINHGYDQYWLLLNPELTVTMQGEVITWSLGFTGTTGANVVYVTGDWLIEPSLMPSSVASELAAAGLTTADYEQILASNPFSGEGTAIDPNRFLLVATNGLPYEPGNQPGSAPDSQTFTLSSTTTQTDTTQVQAQYQVTCTLSAGIDTPLTAKLSESGSLTFTITATEVTAQSATQTASLILGGPSFAYSGPTELLIYWDTIFNCFMFAFPAVNPSVAGVVTTSAGVPPPAGTEVMLTIGATTLTTFTDARGTYRFYDTPTGTGTVTVQGQSQTFPVPSQQPPTIVV